MIKVKEIDLNSKKRILWIFEHYAVPPTMSGFVRQYDHARFLEKRHGWKSRIFASAYSHKAHRNERDVSLFHPTKSQLEEGIEFTWVYTTPYTRNNWKRYVNLVSYLVNSQIASFGKERPNVILAASPHLFAAFAGYLVAKRLRVPFIMEVQDLWPKTLIQLGLKNRIIIRGLEILERFLYSRADLILTLADGITDGVKEKLTVDKKIVLLPNGASIPQSISTDERNAYRSANGWAGKYVGVWVGQHGTMNRLDTVVDAARISHENGHLDLLYVLIGDGPEKPELRKMGQHLPNLIFVDPVPPTEVPKILQSADVGFMIYRDFAAMRGARPTKLSEYMAVGLPIINNLQGEAANIIGKANAGVTTHPEDPSALAGAFQAAFLDQGSFRDKGANGPAYVKATHDREMLAGRLGSLLDELAQRTQ